MKNDNRGCDLEGIKVLGKSVISAVARYPYQPVSDPDKKSASLTKTVKSLFTKFVSYFPKGKGAANENARIVVAHAQDIDGKPFANERVCFFVDDEADGAFGFTGETGRTGARLTVGGSPAPELGRYDVCRYTDANGNAAIEVINSDPQRINVTAYFVDEGLLRDVDVNFALANSSGGPNPPANGTSLRAADRRGSEHHDGGPDDRPDAVRWRWRRRRTDEVPNPLAEILTSRSRS